MRAFRQVFQRGRSIFSVGKGGVMQIQLPLQIGALEQLSFFLEEMGRERQIPKKIISEMDLALGELVTNIIKYSRPGKNLRRGTKSIQVDCNIKGDKIHCLLTSAGPAFNPLGYQPKNLNAGIADRPLGGLGIRIAKKCVDSLSYERKEGMNQLHLIKIINKKGN